MMSFLTRGLTAAALTGASLVTVPTAATAAACQTPGGCLLPLAPRVVTPVTPVTPPPYVAPATAAPIAAEPIARGGFPVLAVLGALAAAGAILAIVLSNNDDDEIDTPDVPVSA